MLYDSNHATLLSSSRIIIIVQQYIFIIIIIIIIIIITARAIKFIFLCNWLIYNSAQRLVSLCNMADEQWHSTLQCPTSLHLWYDSRVNFTAKKEPQLTLTPQKSKIKSGLTLL